MTRQTCRRRGRLAFAAFAAWALVTALIVALSVAGGVRQAGANPVGQSPGVYIGGDDGFADAFTLGALQAGGAAGTQIAGSPGSFEPITAIAMNATATHALMGVEVDGKPVSLDLVNVATNAIVFTDGSDLQYRIVGIAMDPANAAVGYVVTSDQATNGFLYRVTIGASSFSVAGLTPNGLGVAPTSVAIAPNGGTLFVGFTSPSASPPNCGIDAVPAGNPAKSVLWESCGTTPINDVAVSPDGSHVYAAAGFLRTGELISLALPLSAGEGEPSGWPKTSPPFVYNAVTVSPDSGTVYAGETSGATNQDARVQAIRASGATVAGTAAVPLRVNANEQGGLSGLALAPDGRTLIVAGWQVVGNSNVSSTYPVNLTSFTTGPGSTFPAAFGTTTGPQDVAITPDQAPTAAVASDGAVQVGHPLAFDATPSSVQYGAVTNFAWTFDDGGTASGQTVTHVFNTVGTHSVTLRETDSAGTSVPMTVSGFPVDTAGQTPYARSNSSAQITLSINVTAGPPPTTSPTLPHHTTTTQPHHPGTPTLTLKPTVGPPGTIVTVTGKGFAHNSLITVSWSLSSGSVVIPSDKNGNLRPSSLFILTPDILGPRFAVASSSPHATARFLVVPSDSEPGGDDASLLYRSEGP